MIYATLFIFLFLLGFLTYAKLPSSLNLLIIVITSFIITTFVGLRGDIDPDYSSYFDIFKMSGAKYDSSLGVEFGYYYFNHLIYKWGGAFQIIIFTMAVLSLLPKIVFFHQHSPNFGLSVFIYFCTILFLFDFIAIRQAVTLALFMVSLPLIYKKKFWLYATILTVASLIHITAILLIPLYFLLNKKFSKKSLYFIVGVCTIVNVARYTIPILDFLLSFIYVPGVSADKLSTYMLDKESAFLSLKQLSFGFAFIFLKDKLNTKSEMVNLLINLFVSGIFIGTLFNGLPQFAYRIKWYFLWPEAILVVYMIAHVAKNDLKKAALLYLVLAAFYGYTLFNFLNSQAEREKNYFFPYKFYFQQ